MTSLTVKGPVRELENKLLRELLEEISTLYSNDLEVGYMDAPGIFIGYTIREMKKRKILGLFPLDRSEIVFSMHRLEGSYLSVGVQDPKIESTVREFFNSNGREYGLNKVHITRVDY